jgi:hypothetical protein
MPRFSIQFRDGPALDCDAEDREAAWDAYKLKTGLRRTTLDPDPTVILIPPVLTAPAAETPAHADPSRAPKPDNGAHELRDDSGDRKR